MDSFDPRIGSVLTLRRMLDSDISLIIPDMQRDYCWDSVRVGAFVRQLTGLFGSRGSVTMGLLYGYESPPGSHRMMLIDGQQRITTLFLLLGMLYRRTPEPWLRRLLISDYELSDDCQPRLIYQVRNEAMYFMSDLVINFFLNRDGRLSRIRDSHWYFTSYDADPTVVAALAAIHAIDDELERAALRRGWDFGKFAVYVADSLLFIYHDMGSRAQAERMFVTLNTTGEQLTLPQIIKTELYLHAADKADFARRWGEMEQWCWARRPNPADTGDGVLSRLFAIRKARCAADGMAAEYGAGAMDSICSVFTLYSRLVAEVPEAVDMDPARPDHLFMLLPSMEYIARWGGGADRLWRMLVNITRYRRISTSAGDAATAIRLVREMPDSDIVSLLRVRGRHDRVLTPEETGKLRLLSRAGTRRAELEGLIDRAQRHPLLNGCVMPVADWCRGKDGNGFDIARFRRYIDRIYEIWPGDIDCNPDLDTVRRALLSLRHEAYPMARRNGVSFSLAWHDYDWQRLMATAPALIRRLIDCIPPREAVADAFRRLIDRFADNDYEWAFLVRRPRVMAVCAHRMLLRPCEGFVGMHLAGSDGETRWYVGQHALKPDRQEFTNLHTYGSRCIYTDHHRLNIAIDICREADPRYPYRIEVFARDDGERRRREPFDIRAMMADTGLPVSFDRRRRRHYTLFADASSVAAAFNRLTNPGFIT